MKARLDVSAGRASLDAVATRGYFKGAPAVRTTPSEAQDRHWSCLMSHEFHDMNTAPAQVRSVRKPTEWNVGARLLFARGWPIANIARRFGVAYATVQAAVDVCRRERDARRYVPRPPKHSPETVAAIMDARKAGLSARQVGAKFGLSRNAILGLCYRHGDRS